jgi:multidrug efflux system outer membrane protein
MTRRAGTLFALVALTGVLTGCAVGPNYKRPAVTAPEQVRGAPAAEAASLADRPWWEVFGDDALKSLIDEALRNNYDIREAAWRVAEFRARAGVARADFFPQVQYQGQVSRSRQSDFVVPGSTAVTLYDVNLGLSWELDLWGRIRRLSESALAQYLATEEARRGVLLSTVSDVARAYFALRELDARLEIARRTTDAFRETLDLFSRQLAGGIASQLEVSRAEGAMRNAAGAVSDLERQIVAQENLIGFLLGRNPGPVTRGASLTEQALVPEVPAGLPSALLERRPDIRQAEQQLVAANASVGAAMASFFPTISLTGAFGAVSTDLSNLFPAGKTWSIAAGLTGPLFQGMRLKNQYEVNVALFEEARVRYESAVTNAFGEVSTALVAYQKLALTEKEQAGSVAAYQEAVRLANIRYVAGLANYVEVLDAEQQLFPAENALAQTRFLRLDAFVQLYKALGGGWNIADPAWTRQASATPAAK